MAWWAPPWCGGWPRSLAPSSPSSAADVDLRDQAAVDAWVDRNRPDAVVLAAAKVGGILANNSYPADFLYDNLMIQSNVIAASHRAGVAKPAVSRVVLHLSSIGIAAHSRRLAADGAAGANKRVVCHRQDRRGQGCVRPIGSSTMTTIYRPCRPISTGLAITSIFSRATFCRR